jgi:dephospho-CoA kinase
MLATQQEAIYISDVYDNLTASQLEKRIDNMADDAVKTAADYAGGNLKYEKKAVIIIGPPGAGKSTFAEDIAARKGYAIVDADDIKKQMPEFKNGIGANATHKFSKILAASLNRQFISEGANLIIPKVTGRAKQKTGLYKTKRFIKDLINSGYKVDIVYPDADINQAIVRNVTRFAETGRFVNLDYLLSIDNSVRDTYNLLKEIAKEEPTFKNVGFAYINNNYKIGEEIVEEDTTELFQDDRIVDENRIRSRGGREKTLREEEITEQNNALLRIAEEQKQNSIAAGVTPVINTNASPNAVATAVKTQQEIKNSPAENNADVNTILADIPNETKIKYSFNKSNKPLNKNAEELIENLTVRDDTIENKTTGQLVLEGFKSVDPLAFREGFLDQYARLAETDYKAGRKNKYGDKMLLASMSAGAALYFSDRSGDIFQQAFLRGVPVYDKDKGYTYVTNISPIDNKPITPFFDVFKPAYENPNLLWAFQSVMRVKRETRFNREGRKVKVTAADRKKAKQVLQDYPELQTMIDEYNRTNEHTVQFLVDTGVLDEQTGKTWLENADYIPFYRPLEGVEGFKGPQIFQGLSVTPFQRAKGSEEKDIVDPITGITNNLRAAINLGMKNIAANRVMRNFVDMGIAQKVKGNVKGPDIVTIRVKGKNAVISIF